MKILFVTGMILIIVGIFLLTVSSIIMTLKGSSNKNFEIGFGGFIGPIPFRFFSSKNAFLLWLLIVILGLIIWFVIRKSF